MGRSQLEVGGVLLDGVRGRVMHSAAPILTNNLTGLIRVEVLVQATSTHTLEQNWQQFEEDFQTEGERVRLWMDDEHGPLKDIYVGDGTTVEVATTTSQVEGRESTSKAMAAVVDIGWSRQLPVGTPEGPAPEVPTPFQRFQGQVGDWKILNNLDASRIETRTIQIAFGPQFDPENITNLTITGVVADPGGSVFAFADQLPASLPPDGTRITVSGTGLYDGTHDVLAVDPVLNTILVDVAFAGDATGAANLGFAKLGEELYLESRDELLELIGVGPNGVRNSETGLFLAVEQPEELRQGYTVTLVAEYSPVTMPNWVAQVDVTWGESEPTEFPTEQGVPLVAVKAAVRIRIRKDLAPTDNLKQLWTQLQPLMRGYIEQQRGEPVDGLIDDEPVYNAGDMSISWTAEFVSGPTERLGFSRIEAFQQTRLFTGELDSEGYDYLQAPRGRAYEVAVAIEVDVVQRSAEIPDVDPPPAPSGYMWLDVSKNRTTPQPQTTRIGEYHAHKVNRTFELKRLRPGAQIEEMSSEILR